MSSNWKTIITIAASVAALAGGSVLYAQSTTPPSSKDGSGMMMQGQHGDMMQGQHGDMMQGQHGDMMTQMNQMVETCNSMMKDMGKDQKPMDR